MQGIHPYRITVKLSGNTQNFENKNTDGSFTFMPRVNARTSDKSTVTAVKQIANFTGCKVEKLSKSKKEVYYDYRKKR